MKPQAASQQSNPTLSRIWPVSLQMSLTGRTVPRTLTQEKHTVHGGIVGTTSKYTMRETLLLPLRYLKSVVTDWWRKDDGIGTSNNTLNYLDHYSNYLCTECGLTLKEHVSRLTGVELSS